MNTIIKYFRATPFQSIIYAVILIVTLAITTIFFGWSLFFIGRIIDSLVASPEEEAVTVSEFNLVEFKTLTPKLNIVLPPEFEKPIQVEEKPASSEGALPTEAKKEVATTAQVATSSPETTATSTVAEGAPSTETTRATSSPENLRVQILNGTLTPGLAKLWQGKFEASGFKNIVIGNALEKSKNSLITYKSSKKDALPLVKEVLTKEGASVPQEEEAKEEQTYDFVIVVTQ